MTKNTIWITGSSGRLGAALAETLRADAANRVIGTDQDVDITDLDAVMQAAQLYHPAVIINCAGITDKKYCEDHMVEAFKVNALGARNLAAASCQTHAQIVQISTDEVFDGNAAGFVTEFDTPNPVSVYGKSKLAGENYVREQNKRHLILRSSWVYGTGNDDYFCHVARQAKIRTTFDAPMDSISSPTSVAELARVLMILIRQSEYGIFHASCEGVCTRFAFAKAILEGLGCDPALVNGVLSGDGQKTSAVLENLLLKMTGIYEMPQWQDCLAKYIRTRGC